MLQPRKVGRSVGRNSRTLSPRSCNLALGWHHRVQTQWD
jgi:hypothetical protein